MGSFYARVLGVFLVTALLLLIVIISTWRWVVHEGDQHPLRPVAINHLRYLVDDIGVPPDLEKAEEITTQIPVRIAVRGPDMTWSSDPGFMDFPEKPEWRELQEPRILRYRRHHFAIYPQGDYRFYVSWRHRFLQPADKIKLGAGLLMVAVIFWLSYLATQRLLRPVRAVSAAATRIKNGELDYRVNQSYGGELGALCQNVNDMADSLQELIEAKRQLLLAISHELRSPITRAKVNSEFISEDKIRRRIVADMNEMEQLVGTLIESERLNQPHAVLNPEPTDMQALLMKVRTLWPEKDIRVSVPAEPVHLNIDPARFELMVRNVVANAVHYGRDKPVLLSMERIPDGRWCLAVADEGEGIDAQHMPRLGNPFYRPDDSRQRRTGGTGLGLYLARRIIEAHGGVMEIVSRRDTGTGASGTTVKFLW